MRTIQSVSQFVLFTVCLSLISDATTAIAAEGKSAPRKFVKLTVFPESLTLEDVRDARRLLVTGHTEAGMAYDLSANAVLKSAGPQATIDADGYVTPAKIGQTKVLVSAEGLTAEIPVTVKKADEQIVSFVREIIPTLSKVGCNAGTCHGARTGKNGFKLSLRGYDTLYDYRALVDDISGRRFNRAVPDQSLMLLKPTQGVPHEGGFLFDEGSRYYDLIHQWISEGCSYDTATRVVRLEIFPKKPLLNLEGDTQQQIVIAYFDDGSSRDVSRDAIFESSDFEVAVVTKEGQIKAIRRGESAILVRYEGAYVTNPVAVLGNREGFEWADSPEQNFVDTQINKKLQRMKILPSELCTDAEFLRRIKLDLTGVTPSAEQVRAFLNDKRPSNEKRLAMIDTLLDSEEFVDHWTLKWSDLLMSNRKYIKEKGIWAFRSWIRNAIATNKPYDEFVYELITASGSTFENPPANYYRIAREPTEVMENMTQVFVGTRFMCAQCHDHPFERWTQNQYYELSAFFAGVGRRPGPTRDEEIVYTLATPGKVVHAGTGQATAPAFPYTHAGMSEISGSSLRVELAEWLTAKENPYFATSLVNRYWSYFFGRGIIDPVDDIRSSNPPSNPELLAALETDFLESGFDLKNLIRTIVSSYAYQRTYRTNKWNDDDTLNFSHAAPRRLTAEQLYDAIMTTTDAAVNIPGVPAGFRATQLPDPKIDVSFLDMFGRPPRESPCECERSSEVSLGQTLNLVNGPTVATSVSHPQGRIAKLIAQDVESKVLIEEVYLAAVCRLPTVEEEQNALDYIVDVGNRKEAAEDLMWALINSPAFLFNR